jgi:hypothetical protein
MKPQYCLSLFTMAGLLACSSQSLHAQNIVLNNSFEADGGSFDSWNVTPANPAAIPPSPAIDDGSSMLFLPYDGAYYALFSAPSPTPDVLDQLLTTTPGASYDINYWVNDSYGSSDITVTWGSTTLSHLDYSYDSGPANGGWVDYDFVAAATSGSTDLAFAGFTDTAFGLDNISVTQVPEPCTLTLAGLGCLAQLAFRRLKKN